MSRKSIDLVSVRTDKRMVSYEDLVYRRNFQIVACRDPIGSNYHPEI